MPRPAGANPPAVSFSGPVEEAQTRRKAPPGKQRPDGVECRCDAPRAALFCRLRMMPTHKPASLSSPMAPQFLRYAAAGALGTGLHYAVLVGLVQFVRVDAVLASTAGAVVGALVNYALNYRYTFGSDRAHRQALPRFALVAVAGIAVNALVMAAILAFAGPHYLVAQVIATATVLAAGYLANRAWTF
jgi:putative flippase GtrA